MELTQLRYFLEVAETQHITRSAEKLHIAQPALSQAIHRLEKDLGVPLFANRGRNIVLTEYGKYLKTHAAPLLAELEELPRKLRTLAKLEGQTIHLNALAATALLTEAIIAYREHHGDVQFQMLQNAESDLFDIGVTTRFSADGPEDTPTASGDHFVCREEIFLAVPKNHPFAALPAVSLAQAAGEGFISLMGSRQLRWICDRYCTAAGFTPRILFESDSPAAVQNMIAVGMGIGFWPEFTWGRVDREKITLLPITDPHCRRDLLLERKHNKENGALVDDFFAFLCGFIEEAREGIL